jgi:hypothetical protein
MEGEIRYKVVPLFLTRKSPSVAARDPTGSKSSGVAKAGFTYGIAKAGVDVTYSGPAPSCN